MATVIKTVNYWQRGDTDQHNRMDSPKIDSYSQLSFDMCERNSLQKKQLFQQIVLEQLDIHKQKNKPLPVLHFREK